MRILAIHAHPDDVEILAGGTMALLAAAGCRLTIVSMTPGDCGSAELPPDELSALMEWIEEYAADAWDRQIADDFRDGRFEGLRERAREQRRNGGLAQQSGRARSFGIVDRMARAAADADRPDRI